MEHQTKTPIRLEIQGLRAAAVGAVIADHLLGWPRGGFVGVDVFFVVSGYLITGLLMREYERSETISFVNFYRRRVKRIMPVALFVLLVTTAASWALLSASRFSSLILDVIASTFFAANWRFGAAEVDYFQQSLPPSPVQHYWSLAVEEQFYFIWPWLMLGLLLVGHRRQWWGRQHARFVAGAAITVISVASLGWAFHESVASPAFAYFSTFSRIWELGLGAMVAIAAPYLASIRRPMLLATASWVGLLGIVASFLAIDGDQSFPAPWALPPVLATALVLATSAANGSQPWLLTNPISRYLGDISYSLYLWHFPVVVLLLTVMPGETRKYWVLGAVLTFVLSVGSYHLLEQPARHADWLRWNAGRVAGLARGWRPLIAVGLAVVLASVAVSYVLDARQARVGSGATSVLESELPVVDFDRTSADLTDCVGAAALDPSHRCRSLNPAQFITPDPDRLAKDTGGAYACYSPAYAAEPTPCSYGPEDGMPVAIVGDSHGATLAAALREQVDEAEWRLTTFIGRGCRLGQVHPQCPSLPAVTDELTSGKFDVVIVTGRRQPNDVPNAAQRIDSTEAAIRKLVARGVKVVSVEDNPTVTAELMDCVNRIGFTPARNCRTTESAAYPERVDDFVTAARRVRGASVVTTRDLYCVDGMCPAMIGNVFVYVDLGGHVSASYLRTVSPYLVGRIMEAAELRK